MEVIGDTTLLRDLFYPEVLGKGGTPRRRLVFVPPGGKAGVVSAERLRALAEAGIPVEHFDVAVGSSAGSFNLAAHCAGKAHEIRQVYEHLCDVPFFFPGLMGDWLDIPYLVSLLRNKLDQETIRNCRTDLLIGVSDLRGNLHLHDAKQADDVLALCHASSAIPLLTQGVALEGEVYVDGGCAHPCPVGHVVRETRMPGEETDILLLANRPRPEKLHWLETWAYWALVHAGLMAYPWSLRASTAALDMKLGRAARMFEKKHKRYRLCAVFPTPESGVLPFEWHKPSLRRGADVSYATFSRLLKEVRPAAEV